MHVACMCMHVHDRLMDGSAISFRHHMYRQSNWPRIRTHSKWSGTRVSLYRGKINSPLLSLIQWSLSTRDKLGTLVSYTVEPLYKGQVGDGSIYCGASLQGTSSFVSYRVEPLYKGQAGDSSFVSYTVGGFSAKDKLGICLLSLVESLFEWSLT